MQPLGIGMNLLLYISYPSIQNIHMVHIGSTAFQQVVPEMPATEVVEVWSTKWKYWYCTFP